MSEFLQGLLGAIINAAAKGVASAGDAGADLKTTGVAAGASAVAGALTFILSKPAAQHPAVVSAVQRFAPVAPSRPFNSL